MELTPPSLTKSRCSPMVKPIASPSLHSKALAELSEASAASYPSPDLLEYAFKSVTPYYTNDLLGAPSPVSILSDSWSSPGPEVMAPEQNHTISNVLPSTDYDFASYDPSLGGTYPLGESYSAPPPHSTLGAGLIRTPPPPRPSTTIGLTASLTPRNSFSYGQGDLLAPPKVDSLPSYGQALGNTGFSSAAVPTMVFNSTESHFSHSPQPYYTENSLPVWPKDDMRRASVISAGSATSSITPMVENDAARMVKKQAVRKTGRTPRKHTTREEANFQCSVKGCGKFFSRSYNFKSHMETHDDKREYPFPCQVAGCIKKFVRKTDLTRHHQSVHTKERNHQCDYCERLFARKDTLRRHMEDGCSKRFDLGTMDIRGNANKRSSQPKSPMPSVAHSPLPPPMHLQSAHGSSPGILLPHPGQDASESNWPERR